MKITIGHLYPDLLNLYGDRGNIQCLMKRCQWRGIEAETIPFELDDKIDFSKLDIVLLGGGSDREQMIVCEKLQKIQPDFKAYVEVTVHADKSLSHSYILRLRSLTYRHFLHRKVLFPVVCYY